MMKKKLREHNGFGLMESAAIVTFPTERVPKWIMKPLYPNLLL